jgi:hypothetical protein
MVRSRGLRRTPIDEGRGRSVAASGSWFSEPSKFAVQQWPAWYHGAQWSSERCLRRPYRCLQNSGPTQQVRQGACLALAVIRPLQAFPRTTWLGAGCMTDDSGFCLAYRLNAADLTIPSTATCSTVSSRPRREMHTIGDVSQLHSKSERRGT